MYVNNENELCDELMFLFDGIYNLIRDNTILCEKYFGSYDLSQDLSRDLIKFYKKLRVNYINGKFRR